MYCLFLTSIANNIHHGFPKDRQFDHVVVEGFGIDYVSGPECQSHCLHCQSDGVSKCQSTAPDLQPDEWCLQLFWLPTVSEMTWFRSLSWFTVSLSPRRSRLASPRKMALPLPPVSKIPLGHLLQSHTFDFESTFKKKHHVIKAMHAAESYLNTSSLVMFGMSSLCRTRAKSDSHSGKGTQGLPPCCWPRVRSKRPTVTRQLRMNTFILALRLIRMQSVKSDTHSD